MEVTEHDITDIHILIQQRSYDFLAFIRECMEQIDNHIEVCEECRERMIWWTSHLPKLRARMTVQFPKPTSYSERLDQMKQLKRGQCLPCGCQVTDIAWTREQASAEFYNALAQVLEVSEAEAKNIPDKVRLQELPLSTKSLRRLRDKFWMPDGSYGSEELRDSEEGDKVRQLPETISHFIKEILSLHSGMSYAECSDHWCP